MALYVLQLFSFPQPNGLQYGQNSLIEFQGRRLFGSIPGIELWLLFCLLYTTYILRVISFSYCVINLAAGYNLEFSDTYININGVSNYHLNLAQIQRQAEEWESFIVEKGMASAVGGCWHGEVGVQQAHKKWGYLCPQLGVHIWLSLVDSKLEAGANIKEAGSY